MRQPKWSHYEAVLLVEAFWMIKKDKSSRKSIIAQLSAKLRSFAKAQGLEIDDTFRNENGISMRLGELEYLFSGDGSGLKNTSDLFREIVDLYGSDYNQFEKLLMEAKAMIAGNRTVEADFMRYLSANVPPTQLSGISWCYSEIEGFCLKVKVLQKPLFQTTDFDVIKKVQRTIEQNKIFRIMHKKQFNKIVTAGRYYYVYIKEGRFPNLTDAVATVETPSVSAAQKTAPEAPTAKADTEAVYAIDFNGPFDFPNTKPESFSYFGETKPCGNSWAELYVRFVATMIEDCPYAFSIGMKFSCNGSRIELANKFDCDFMFNPKPINGTDYVVETHMSASNMASKMKFILELCNVDFENVVITYKNKSTNAQAVVSDEQRDKSTPTGAKENISFAEWLRNIEKMADGTCRSYSSAINKAEEFAQVHHLAFSRMVGTDKDEALGTVTCLMENAEFRHLNSDQHNRFSAAFQKLEKYYQYLDPTGVVMQPALLSKPARKVASVARVTVSEDVLVEELSAFLKSHTDGVSKDAILAHFSKYSTQQINRALVACHAVKVLKQYYHKDCISDYTEMADILLDVLLKQFAAKGDYTSAQLLYNEAHFRLDDFFFYNNAFESRMEVYDLAAHLFSQEQYKGYTFLFVNGMHIWKSEPDYPKDFHGLMIKYGREHHNVFTREEAVAFYDSIGSATPVQSFSNVLFTTGSKSFLQYDENCFVLCEALHVNDNFLHALKAQIENLLEGEVYIAFGEIDDYFYTTLPALPTNISWSPLLLEDMLRVFDIGYTTVEAGEDNDKKTIPAAILRTNSQFRTFSDLVWNEISKAYLLPKELTAMEFREFLLNRGFIHGSEKMWNVHKTVAGDLRFYWTEENGKVTIH